MERFEIKINGDTAEFYTPYNPEFVAKLKFLSKSVDIYSTVCYNIDTVKEVSRIEEQEKPKKKSRTSNEAKMRYSKKTYERYAVSFRKIDDIDCIDAIKDEMSKGYTVSEAFKRLIRKSIGKL